MPRRHLALLAGAIALSVLSCGREPTAPHQALNSGVVRSQGLAWIAKFPEGLAQFQASGGSGVAFTKVRVVLNNPDGSVALDTLVDFPPGATEIQATLSVILPASAPASGQPLVMNLDYQNAAGGSVFHGGPVTVTAVPAVPGAGPPPPSPVVIPISYVGPGAGATKVVISPKTANVPMGSGFTFSAQALDASNNVIPNTPIVFNVGDGALATVNAATGSGVAAAARRGTTTVTAQLLTGPVDVATLNVTPIASAIALVSGSGQTGSVNNPLANSLIVRVTAPDGLPAAGVAVNFAASNGGTAASATTDGSGLASTIWKLGTFVGGQTVVASAAGAGSVTFNATAKPADPAKLEFSAQPPGALASGEAFGATVRVLDATGQLSSDFTGVVTLNAVGGGGSILGNASVSAVGGVATFSGLKIVVPGTYTLTATASSPTGPIAPASSSGIVVSPGSVARLVYSAYPAGSLAGAVLTQIVVTARDDANNVATNFTGAVALTASLGPAGGALLGATSVNAVAGVATFNAVRITVAGSYVLTATAAGATVTGSSFAVVPGPASALAIVSGAGQSAPGASPLPAPVIVRVTDAFGNGVDGPTVTFAPSVGSGSASPATVVAGSAGIAQTVWTVGSVAGLMTMNISSPGLAPNPLVITANATSTAGTARVWTGATSTDWNTATNWTPNGVPGGADPLTIPSTGNAPVIGAPAVAGSVSLAAGVTLTNNSTLVISGNVAAGSTIVGTGSVTLSGSGTWTGKINQNVTVAGNFTVAAADTVNGNVSVIGTGLVTIGASSLFVSGTFGTSGSGKLAMTSAAGVLKVMGAVNFAGGTSTPSAGKMYVFGDLTTTGAAFQAAGTHETWFVSNTGLQTITGSAAVAGQGLRHVHFDSSASRVISGAINFSGDMVIHSASPAVLGTATVGIGGNFLDSTTTCCALRAAPQSSAVTRLTPGGRASVSGTTASLFDYYGGWQVTNTVLFGTSTITAEGITTALTITGSVMPLQDFDLNGDLTVSGSSGLLDLNGFGITVYGNFSTAGGASGGRLKMTNVGDTDYLGVAYNATFAGGSTTGLLTHGYMEVMGDFTQSGSATSFAADPGHQLELGILGYYWAGVRASDSQSPGWTNALAKFQADATAKNAANLARVNATRRASTGTRPALPSFAGGKQRPRRFDSLAGSAALVANAPTVAGTPRSAEAARMARERGDKMRGRQEASRAALLQKHPRALAGRDPAALRSIVAKRSARTKSLSAITMANGGVANYEGEIAPSTVTFANPGASSSHFGTLYLAGDAMILNSNVEVAGQFQDGHSFSHTVSSSASRVLTSHGAEVRSLLFDNTRWVILDGPSVSELDDVGFQNMDPTQDQFTIARTGDELNTECECNYYYLYDWYFYTTPTTGRYVNATDTNQPSTAFEIYMEDPIPGTHGGHVFAGPNVTITHWPSIITWTGLGTTDSWNESANWSPYSPWSATDVIIPSGAPRMPHIPLGGSSARNVTVQTGMQIFTDGNSLAVYGDLIAPTASPATVSSFGEPIYLYGDWAQTNTITGNFADLYVANGEYKIGTQVIVQDEMQVETNLSINGGRLDIGDVGGTLPGSLSLYYNGTLTMTNPADQVFVGTGGAWFEGGSTTIAGGSPINRLTAGTITLVSSATDFSCLHAMDYYQPTDVFSPSGTHKVVFTGPAAHPSSVEFYYNTTSFLNNAEIAPGSGMALGTNVMVMGTLARGAGSGSTLITSVSSANYLLTTSGLSFSSAFATNVQTVVIKFADGTSNGTFNNVVWTGHSGLLSGSLFESARTTGGPFTFDQHNFTGAGITTSPTLHYVSNSGTVGITLTNSGSGAGDNKISSPPGNGTINWP